MGLKGVAAEDLSKVEALVEEVLKELSEEGFSENAVEAAVNTVEFGLRENNTGSFPRGLSLMLRSVVSVVQVPLKQVGLSLTLEQCRSRCS